MTALTTRALVLAAALALACGPAPGASAPAAPATNAPAASAPAAPTAASAAGPATAAPPAAPVRVQAAYSSVTANQSPWWIALEGGYFREQGLDLQLTRIDAGATLLAGMHQGEVQLAASGGPALVLGNLQGLDTMIVGSASNVLDVIIFTRPEIQTVADLRGKTIGVSRLKSITDVAARLGLERMGLHPDVDVFTRGTGGIPESLAALEGGTVDGASINGPAIFQARKRGYRELLPIQDLGIPFLTAGVGSTRRVIAEQPAVIDGALRALAQAINRLRTDREYAMQVIGQYSQSDDAELLSATVDYIRPQLQPDLYPDPAAIQGVLDLEENPAARAAKPDDVADFRFADRLKTSGFLDRLPQ
ncbi:MAG TPA: ABC transporter substrate-binding protein [Chloroflexota bacterium]|nr:ABC transporter substrate-binding protein [Chloroflexota bacterium]